MAKGISEADKLRIFRRDMFTCQYCDLNAAKDFDTWWHANLNVDHINPQGSNDDSNLATACRACNLYKWKHPCKNKDEAREIVRVKRLEAMVWYQKHVLQVTSN